MNHTEEIQELTQRMSTMKREDSRRTELLERAIKLADRHNDLEKAFRLRIKLVESAIDTGRPEKSLAAYAYVLGMIDQYPEKFKFSHEVAWYYKWVLPKLTGFPNIPLERIEATLKDMKDRYLANGFSEKVVTYYRFKIEMDLGNYEKAAEYHELQKTMTGGFWEMDCPACVLATEVEFEVLRGNYEAALEKAQPILEGKRKCGHVPERTYVDLFFPFLEMGRKEEALEFATKLEGKISDLDGDWRYADDLMYADIVREDYSKALTRLERVLGIALAGFEKSAPASLYLCCEILFRLMAKNGEHEINASFPESFPLYSPEGKYDPQALADWFAKERESISEAFSKRDGNRVMFETRDRYLKYYLN